MGRTAASRTLLFVVIAGLGLVALPVVGIGQPISSHGGLPSDVYMNTYSDAPGSGVCNGEDPVRKHVVQILPTAVSVGEESHILVYFTSTISINASSHPELALALQIEGADVPKTSQDWIEHDARGHTTVTVMWTFETVAPGDYTVQATARVPGLLSGDSGANLQACALSVFVIPASVEV